MHLIYRPRERAAQRSMARKLLRGGQPVRGQERKKRSECRRPYSPMHASATQLIRRIVLHIAERSWGPGEVPPPKGCHRRAQLTRCRRYTALRFGSQHIYMEVAQCACKQCGCMWGFGSFQRTRRYIFQAGRGAPVQHQRQRSALSQSCTWHARGLACSERAQRVLNDTCQRVALQQ